MEILEYDKRRIRRIPRIVSIEAMVGVLALVAAVVMVWIAVTSSDNVSVMVVAGILFTACVVVVIFLMLNPDTVRARQTDSVLRLSSQILDQMSQGLPPRVAQSICTMLLPNTAAIAVAITDTETILGYVGYLEAENPQGANIRTQATHDALNDGQTRVIYTAEEIGLPKTSTTNVIKAAIIVPLRVGKEIRGTLKFYYRSSQKITETQKSIAQGFGELLSTQMAALEMENQRELATSMELKMLQNRDEPPLPLQHHQHHRVARSAPTPRRPGCCFATSPCSTGPPSRTRRTAFRFHANSNRRNATSPSRWPASARTGFRWRSTWTRKASRCLPCWCRRSCFSRWSRTPSSTPCLRKGSLS